MVKLAHALACLALAATSSRAHAGVVLTFDSSRCYTYTGGPIEYYLTGNAMVGPLSQLQAHGYTVQTTGLITAAGLAGVDVFVTGLLNPGATLSAQEFADLQAWVFAGGGVLYIGENSAWTPSNNQFGSLVQGPSSGPMYGSSIYSVTIVDPASPIASGLFGTASTIGGLAAGGTWANLTASSHLVGNNPDGTAGLVTVEYGAGRAVLVSDAHFFANPPTYVSDNAALWDNAIEWLAHGGSSGTAMCFGDGSQATACPCGNPGTTGRGCDNSSSTGGARLSAGGATNPDTILLQSEGEKPTAPSIFLQGTLSIAPVPFGDGLRCVHGILKRLYVKPAVAGIVSAPGAGDPSISARSAALGDPLTLGATRWYQVYYRDPDPLYCPGPAGSTFNVSNGLSIQW